MSSAFNVWYNSKAREVDPAPSQVERARPSDCVMDAGAREQPWRKISFGLKHKSRKRERSMQFHFMNW